MRGVAVLLVLASALLPEGAAAGGSGASPAVEPAGPRASARPSTAVVAASFEDLDRLVADTAGPSEVWLPAGDYRGNLVIRRPVAVRGERGARLVGSGQGTVVTIEANDVTVENVAIEHSGRRNTTEDAGVRATGDRIRIADTSVKDTLFGITLKECHACTLERVRVVGSDEPSELRGDGIKLWESNDSVVRSSVVDRARDVVVWYTRRATVENNVVTNGRYGTHFMYAHDGVARHNRYEGNVVGIFVMYSLRLAIESNVLAGNHGAAGMGLGFKDSDAVRVAGNWIVADTTGVYFDNTPRTPAEPVVFDGNVLALNDVALRLHSTQEGIHFTGNDVRDNVETVEVDGGGDALSMVVRGNHFSDYEGYDLDGDGVGDVPHRVSALSSELADEHPALRFFHGTAAMQLVDAVAHAVPVLDRRTLLLDPAPRMASPEVPVP